MFLARPEEPCQSGVLLHPTSLPGRGSGDMGPAAYRFVDWLSRAGQRYWQILPLVPVSGGGSPYNGLSALAGNAYLTSPELLVLEGLLRPEDLAEQEVGSGPIHFPSLVEWKERLSALAYQRFREGRAPQLGEPYRRYREEHASWLDDYALFRALRQAQAGTSWTEWPRPLRDREAEALAEARVQLAWAVDRYAFEQFLFERQWGALRSYAAVRGIQVVGDIPIFVSHDSSDVWSHPSLFQLDANGQPQVVAGVPPDYFSATGQRWGNPLYRWEAMAAQGYRWWVERMRRTLSLVDVVRLDHFRGFEAYWEIPAAEETAVRGRWVSGPGEALFQALQEACDELPIIAEDLGVITPEVEALRDRLGLPGMRVLQFAYDGDPHNPHLPRNHPAATVVYTGTHDNDTTRGWWESLSAEQREEVAGEVGQDARGPHWALARAAFASPARLAILPVQDVLGLGSEARMNAPGLAHGQWAWRLEEALLTEEVAEALRTLTRETGRGS